MALLVPGDVLHARVEAGKDAPLLQVALDEVLAGLCERRLDDQVVHRDRGGEVGLRAVLPEAVGHLVEVLEGLPEAPREVGVGRVQRAVDVLPALHDLLHEAAEEDGVARLVHLLGGQEVLLLLARGGVDERRQVVRHRVLAVEEHRVVPERGAALQVAELLVPLPAVFGEVDLRGAPVAFLPAAVEVVVGDALEHLKGLRHDAPDYRRALDCSPMPTNGQPLAGRRALITGAATGIGRATAGRLAADGASVIVNYVGSADQADSAVKEIAEAGGKAVAIGADVSNEEQVISMFSQAADELGGPVDLLVNNAGIEKPFKVIDMPLEEWQKVLAVNLTGAFLCTREAARGMCGAGITGAVVNVSSVHEVIPWIEFSHYCASKGGLKLFAQSAARELAPHGIRVVNVAPGAILTPINQNLIDDAEKRAEVEAEIPLGRTGRPEEIAAAIAWVAGPDAEYVVGSTIFVDGGMTLYPKFV